MTTTTEEAVRPPTAAELDALPVLSIIRSTGINPHAWQKRVAIIHDGKTALWYVTSDDEWGYTTEALLLEVEGAVLLWEPQQ